MPQVVKRQLIDGPAGAAIRNTTSVGSAARFQREFIQWTRMRPQYVTVTKRLDLLKAGMKAFVNDHGQLDDKGNRVLAFDEPVEVDGVTYIGARCEARKTTYLEEDEAERILRERGLYDDCTVTVISIDQDRVMAAYMEDKLSDADLGEMFSDKVVWAFKPDLAA